MFSESELLAEEPAGDSAGSRITRDRFGERKLLLVVSLAVPISIAIGIGLGWLGSSLDRSNRLAVGNTGKTLSAVIRDSDALVVIGGGTTRTDLTDLMDRSTLPWDREVDLLVIGTNSDQALGALNLIQRGGVSTIAVVGLPESEPIWDLVDSEAARHHTAVKYLDQPMRVDVTQGLTIELAPVDPTTDNGSTGAIVRVRAGTMRFSWIDGVSKASREVAEDPLYDLRANVLIEADGGKVPSNEGSPALSIQPAAARSSAMTKPSSRLSATLESGEQLQMPFSDNELRIPQDQVVDANNVGGD